MAHDHLRRRRVGASMVASAALVLAGCAEDPELDEGSIAASVPAAVSPDAPDEVTGVECAPGDPAVVAQTVACTAVLNGESVDVVLDIADDGTSTATVTPPLMVVADLEADLAAGLAADLGVAVDVACPGTRVVVRDGVEVACVGSADGLDRALLVVLAADGTYTVDTTRR